MGISWRQGPHQLAQKFRSTTCPRYSSRRRLGPSSVLRVKSGASSDTLTVPKASDAQSTPAAITPAFSVDTKFVRSILTSPNLTFVFKFAVVPSKILGRDCCDISSPSSRPKLSTCHPYKPASLRFNIFELPASSCLIRVLIHQTLCWRSECADCSCNHVNSTTAHSVARNHHVHSCVSASMRRDMCTLLVGEM